MMEPINDILVKAKEYWVQVAKRTIAHEVSAEYHRARGVYLGILATVLSAVVGTAIFATVTQKLGLGVGEAESISFPTGLWAWLIYGTFGLIMIFAPVLTGVHTYLNDPQQAEKHQTSSARYYRLQQRIDLFILRYADVNSAASMREEALKELEDISKEIGTVFENSFTLTDKAYAAATAKLGAGTTVGATLAADYGTAAEAKAMLERAIAELKKDEAGALAKFNKGEEGFKDRDLYPFCAGPDGITTAHPTQIGKNLKEIKDKNGKPFGEEMYQVAEEGKIKEVSYLWPRPSGTEPVQKVSYITKVGDQICGVGYYKE